MNKSTVKASVVVIGIGLITTAVLWQFVGAEALALPIVFTYGSLTLSAIEEDGWDVAVLVSVPAVYAVARIIFETNFSAIVGSVSVAFMLFALMVLVVRLVGSDDSSD